MNCKRAMHALYISRLFLFLCVRACVCVLCFLIRNHSCDCAIISIVPSYTLMQWRKNAISFFSEKKKTNYSAHYMFNACHKNINWISLVHKHSAPMLFRPHILCVNCLIEQDTHILCIYHTMLERMWFPKGQQIKHTVTSFKILFLFSSL